MYNGSGSNHGNWADIVDQDSNELSFLSRPPQFADGRLTSFDPLLDASSKEGLNAMFARGMSSLLDASNSSNHGYSAKVLSSLYQQAPMQPPVRLVRPFATIGADLPTGSPQPSPAIQTAQPMPAPAQPTPPPPNAWAKPQVPDLLTNKTSPRAWASLPTPDKPPDLSQEYSAEEAVSEPPSSQKAASDRDASPGRDSRSESDSSRSRGAAKTQPKSRGRQRGKETDPHRLEQRQKQVQFGKNTPGYAAYLAAVSRSARGSHDPQTPEYDQVCSKRSWDGQVSKWRRLLHVYDPPGTEEEAAVDQAIERIHAEENQN